MGVDFPVKINYGKIRALGRSGLVTAKLEPRNAPFYYRSGEGHRFIFVLRFALRSEHAHVEEEKASLA